MHELSRSLVFRPSLRWVQTYKYHHVQIFPMIYVELNLWLVPRLKFLLDFLPHTGFQNTKYCGVMRCEVPNSTWRFSICPWTLFKCKIIIYISLLIICKNTKNELWIIVFDGREFLMQYEPELFPGLIYRMKQPKIVLLIFVSGKIVLTGAKVLWQIFTICNARETYTSLYLKPEFKKCGSGQGWDLWGIWEYISCADRVQENTAMVNFDRCYTFVHTGIQTCFFSLHYVLLRFMWSWKRYYTFSEIGMEAFSLFACLVDTYLCIIILAYILECKLHFVLLICAIKYFTLFNLLALCLIHNIALSMQYIM